MIVTTNEAVALLKKGEIVAIPTETVYGLAADAFNLAAIERIFFTKGRPSDNPLIVHIADLEQLDLLTDEVSDAQKQIIDAFWPGPLTLLFKKKSSILDKITAGLETIAVRMPSHPLALEIIKQTGPLVAPSANKSGKPSTTRVEHVQHDYSGLIAVVDGGKCELGLESTVIDCVDDVFTILRPGKIGIAELSNQFPDFTFSKEVTTTVDKPKSPGMKYTHYSPLAKVRWMNPAELEGEYNQSVRYLHIHGDFNSTNHKGYSSNMTIFSREVYDQFRFADELEFKTIAIEPFSKDAHSLAEALYNRISKAIND